MQASVTLADWRGPGLLAGLLSRIGHQLPAWRFDPHGERVSQRQGWRALGVLPAGLALLASFAFSLAGAPGSALRRPPGNRANLKREFHFMAVFSARFRAFALLHSLVVLSPRVVGESGTFHRGIRTIGKNFPLCGFLRNRPEMCLGFLLFRCSPGKSFDVSGICQFHL